MKYWIHAIIIIIVSFLLSYFLPWWNIALVAVVSSFMLRLKQWTALLFGLLAGFILWAMVSFYIDIENQSILSSRIGNLLGGLGPIALIAVTGLLGGLIAALGSLAGASIRSLIKKEGGSL